MEESSRTETRLRYRAFICYSQHDYRAAEKLHRRLENYRVPRRLAGQKGRSGLIPSQLSPIFRDRDELAASADIGERLHDALARSDFLIVLCSPASAQSRWVDAEINTFCAIRPDNRNRVLAVLLAGEPDAADPSLECFPPALHRHEESEHSLGPRYPLAADLRPGRDRRTDAELRLIAALLGAEFDDLKRREQERRIRRLRLTLAAVAALGLALAGLAVFALRQRVHAQQSAVQAKSARAEAEKLVDFMLKDLRPSLEVIGKLELLEPANDKVRAYYETVAPDEEDADILRRRAMALHQYAVDLRSHKKGEKTLQVLLTEGILNERLVQLTPSDPEAWQALAETRRYLALQRRDNGDLTGAMREIGLAMSRQAEAVRLRPAAIAMAARLASLRTEEADVLMRLGRPKEAAGRLAESLKALEELSARDPKNLEIKNRAAAAAWQLGNTFRRLSDYARAEPAFRRSVELAEALRTADAKSVFYLRRLQGSQGSLGQMLMETGRNQDALPVLQANLSIAREIAAIDPASLVYQDGVATNLDNLADALLGLKLAAEALPYARENVELRERALAQGATDLRSRNTLALALATVSAVELQLQHQNEAVAAARRGVAIQQEISQNSPDDMRLRDDLAYLRGKLAAGLLASKQFDDAVSAYRAALVIVDEILAKDAGNPQLQRRGERAELLLGLGSALQEAGKREEAGQTLHECIATIDQAIKDGLAPQAQAENRRRAETLLGVIGAR